MVTGPINLELGPLEPECSRYVAAVMKLFLYEVETLWQSSHPSQQVRAALWRPSSGDKTLLSFFWRLLIQGLYFTHLISIVSCILFSAFIFSIYLVCDLSIRIKDHCTKNDDIEGSNK